MQKTALAIALVATTAAASLSPANATSRNFFTPTVGGDRLSFCLAGEDTCGKPIADAWCRAVGFDNALNYQRDHSLAKNVTLARYADTGDICTGSECESFRQIKCWRES